MKKYLILFSLIIPQLICARAIFGEDNRRDLFEESNETYLHWAKSVAMKVDKSHITEVEGGYLLGGTNYQEEDGLCSDERFVQQTVVGECTGFLIAPDLIVTAGHCLQYFFYCINSYWVFDYAIHNEGDTDYTFIPKKNMIRCEDIVESYFDYENDYSLFRLTKPVTDRPYLSYRSSGKVTRKTPLVVIGHPRGLPMKITDDFVVEGNDHSDYFTTTSDSFAGNSGSPVINANTGEVEGILVRGENDYEWDHGGQCYRPKQCKNTLGWFADCRAEDITRITNINYLVQ